MIKFHKYKCKKCNSKIKIENSIWDVCFCICYECWNKAWKNKI